MTNEEAIVVLQKIKPIPHRGDSKSTTHILETIALDMAIKALEQGSILDKIRVDIEQKQYDFMDDKDYDEGIRFGLMLAYQTVDKYKAESEDKE